MFFSVERRTTDSKNDDVRGGVGERVSKLDRKGEREREKSQGRSSRTGRKKKTGARFMRIQNY